MEVTKTAHESPTIYLGATFGPGGLGGGEWTIRLEAKSEKGPRNHFRGEGMLEDVTHASSPD